jgi:diguanylate cyclase (GGDEF)-like protein
MSVNEMDNSSKSNRKLYLAGAITLAGFLAAYFAMASQNRQLLLFLLLATGLYFSYRIPKSIILFNGLGLILLFTTTYSQWWVMTLGLGILLLVTIAIPLYYEWSTSFEANSFEFYKHVLIERAEILERRRADTEAQLQQLEREIEKTKKLYFLGRELVEHIDSAEVMEQLNRVLLHRPGITASAVFSWEKSGWQPLYLSHPEMKDLWVAFVEQQKDALQEKNFRQLPSPAWVEDRAVVFWPVRLEKEIIAAILLSCEHDRVQEYVDEGSIFIPQIALGLRRSRLFSEVQERSRKDGLTELYLRRYFMERLQAEIQRAKRYTSVFSILMADIDHFKKINDEHGHLAGDHVLKEVARVLSSRVRPGDLAGRYGGEEFIVLLPLASAEEALEVAHTINRAVSSRAISVNHSRIHVTISIGISTYPSDGATPDDLINEADRALYWVKTHGRNACAEASSVVRPT